MNEKASREPRISWFIPDPSIMKFKRFMGQSTSAHDQALPSVWIRAFQVARHLKNAQYQVQFNSVDPLPDIAVFLRRYNADDLRLMQRLKQKGARTVVDVVANYFRIREKFQEGYGGASREQVSSFLGMVEKADQVWSVSPYLTEQSKEVNPSSHFVSDSVDPAHFNPGLYPKRGTPEPVILGWSGTTEKATELAEIGSILEELIDRGLVKVHVISRKSPRLNFRFDFRKWNYSTFPKEIAECDICIAPRRVRNEYDMGHSLFKIGVFMAMGKPALAGPVPSYSLLLEDGQAGAICQSMSDWQYQLTRLVQDISTRESAGVKAAQKMQPYLTPAICSQIKNLLQQVMET